MLTKVSISHIVLFASFLSFHLGDDIRKFVRGTPRSLFNVGRILRPFQSGSRHATMRANKGGGALWHSKHCAVRDIFVEVKVLDLVAGRSIELRHFLEHSLCDFGSGT